MLLYGRNQHNIVNIKNQQTNQATKTPESDDPTNKTCFTLCISF